MNKFNAQSALDEVTEGHMLVRVLDNKVVIDLSCFDEGIMVEADYARLLGLALIQVADTVNPTGDYH